MSDRVTIIAEPRTVIGKHVKALRREGLVPGVIYGQSEPVHVQMDRRELRRALRVVGTTHLADVEVGGNSHTVLVREIQQHVTRGDVLHIDFLEVDMKSTITSEAELVSVGESAPTREGIGTPVLVLRSVEIECLPDALIAEIEVDFNLIETPDDVIYVQDLKVPKGVKVLTDPETAVTSFEYTKLEEEEEEEFVPAADSVEVIGRREEEDFDD
ncbi:MAG: 50S ribosomal protein L25 [Ardenticatenaceae bacterium]|nr:50S ribosomal protein L25 [Ardenticatenaceae bacterium]